MVNSPVLFITFARPDYARKTWNGIRAAKPKILYFYSNKGREEINGEIERNDQIRAFIKEIDWDCDLHTWFRDECVNVYDSLRGAIDWLFDNEDRGIILEEDCVPTLSFFSYIDQMVNLYEKEDRVWAITGCNFFNYNPSNHDILFSHTHYLYGWATWADRWHKIQWDKIDIQGFVDSHICYRLYKTKKQAIWEEKDWLKDKSFIEKTKCWDYVFDYTIDKNEGLVLCPSIHLVTNIGLLGAHHNNAIKSPVNNVAKELGSCWQARNFPPSIEADLKYDHFLWRHLKCRPFYLRVINRLLYYRNILKSYC